MSCFCKLIYFVSFKFSERCTKQGQCSNYQRMEGYPRHYLRCRHTDNSTTGIRRLRWFDDSTTCIWRVDNSTTDTPRFDNSTIQQRAFDDSTIQQFDNGHMRATIRQFDYMTTGIRRFSNSTIRQWTYDDSTIWQQAFDDLMIRRFHNGQYTIR